MERKSLLVAPENYLCLSVGGSVTQVPLLFQTAKPWALTFFYGTLYESFGIGVKNSKGVILARVNLSFCK